MPISAIDAVGAQLPPAGVQGSSYLDAAGSVGAANNGASGSGFGEVLAGAVTGLQAKQDHSSGLAVRAVTGDLDDIHDYTVAASEAKVALELTVAIRNKAVEAFNEVMRMQA